MSRKNRKSKKPLTIEKAQELVGRSVMFKEERSGVTLTGKILSVHWNGDKKCVNFEINQISGRTYRVILPESRVYFI